MKKIKRQLYPKNLYICYLSICFMLVTSFTSFAYYTTRGQNIIDRETGNVVQLRGFGLGCWLLPEGYMFGGGVIDRPRYFEKAVSDLIGPDSAHKFWILWYKNFLVEQDIKDIRRWGCTAIRPALCHNVIQPRDGQPSSPPYKYNDWGWEILDSLVTWCERWHLGIIWDMHAAPGSQGGDNISDSDGEARLWKEPQIYWPRLKDLWYKIAERYKNRKCIIGYDLLNEPLLKSKGYDDKMLRQLYIQLTDTIRKIDTAGIIFVEGQWWARDFSILEPINWDKHLAIAFHEYPPVISFDNMRGVADGNAYDWAALRTKYNIPLWQGETGEQGPPYTRNTQSTNFCNDNNIGWSFWTHKKFNMSTQPWNCPKTSGFQRCIDYWNNRASKPNPDSARIWLFDQARRTNRSFCQFLPDMVRSLRPLNPDAPDTLKPWYPSETIKQTNPFISNEIRYTISKQFLEIKNINQENFNIKIYSVSGKKIIQAFSNNENILINTKTIPKSAYILQVYSNKKMFIYKFVLEN